MNLRRFQLSDLPLINGWAFHRKLPPLLLEEIPKVGFVAEKEFPVAAIFLYQTDSAIAFIDNLIADPNSNPLDREEMIPKLIKHCFSWADLLGFQTLCARTALPTVEEALLKSGFSKSGESHQFYLRRT